MRKLFGASVLAMVLHGAPAWAGDKVLVAPAPDWVLPAPALQARDLVKNGTFVPRFDEQAKVDGDRTTTYIDTAVYVASAEALNKQGTISLAWSPQHGDLTFHKIEILRGDERIDLLSADPNFTVLRREAGLEQLSVDGSLTAVKHLEGLRVGDILVTAFSLSERDEVLAGRAQSGMVLLPRPVQIGFGRARMIWPQAQKLNWKVLQPGVDATPRPIAGGFNDLTIALPVAKLPEMPKDLPKRFEPVPLLLASGFADWADVSSVMAPYYKTDGAIAEGSDLAKVVDGIMARSTDPVQRMADALQTVQEDVRYQLIALGTGNYVPQAPADTWQKRFGDCKAKTLLLLAMLRRMGITAEPVLANSNRGDAVETMPASAMAFDHVFVRAEVAGESFWLDGTALGARLADIRDVPRFGKVLPIRAAGGALLALPQRANARPAADVDLALDLSAGPHLPAPFTLRVRYAGAWAVRVRVPDNAETAEKLQDYATNMAKNWADSSTIGKPNAVYDAKDATWTVAVEGVAYPDWTFKDGHYEVAYGPPLKVGFDPDRSRSAWRALPALIDDPWTAQVKVRMTLPDGGKDVRLEGGEPQRISNPAVAWERSVTVGAGALTELVSSRETGVEVAPDQVSLVKKDVADAMGRTFRLTLPSTYPMRWDDVPRRRGGPAMARVKAVFDGRVTDKPEEAARLDDRNWLDERLMDWAAADADLTKAIALDGTAERLRRRAELRSRLGHQDDALKDAQAAYDLDSGNKDMRYQLAVQLARSGKGDQALELTESSPDPASEEGQGDLLRKVTVLEFANRHDEAMELIDAAIEKRPSVTSFLNTRCWFNALRNQKLDSALADCDKAIELASEPAAYLDSRAMVHFRAGRFKEALADLDGALAIAPELAPSRFMRGVVLGRQGDKPGSLRELAIARKLYPDIDSYLGRFGIKP